MRGFIEMAKARHDRDAPECLWLVAINRERIQRLKTTWKRACEKLGIDGSMFHDLRRTALSNMEEAGIPRSTAMEISGHRTESAYKRYSIGSETRGWGGPTDGGVLASEGTGGSPATCEALMPWRRCARLAGGLRDCLVPKSALDGCRWTWIVNRNH
jgi:hypothetical protein